VTKRKWRAEGVCERCKESRGDMGVRGGKRRSDSRLSAGQRRPAPRRELTTAKVHPPDLLSVEVDELFHG